MKIPGQCEKYAHHLGNGSSRGYEITPLPSKLLFL